MTPEFREALYQLNQDDLGVEVVEVEETFSVDEVEKEKLMNMGFSEKAVTNALLNFPEADQEEDRLDWLLLNVNDELIPDFQPSTKKVTRYS